MDPFTITTTVVKVSAVCLSTAKTLYDIRAKYKDAPMYIISICSETTIISASLSKVQSLLLREPHLPQLLGARPELIAALDAALTGCMVLFSCLDDELRHIVAQPSQIGPISWRGKARVVWNKDKLKELLEGLHGLQISLNLLIQLLQVDSLAEIRKLVEEGRPALATTIKRTQSLRISHPGIQVPESIYSQDDRESGINAAEYPASIWSEQEFEFDDLVVNSKVYRRALAAAKAGKQPANQSIAPLPGDPPSEVDLIDLSDTATITQQSKDQLLMSSTTQDLEGLVLSGNVLTPSAPEIIAQSTNQHTITEENVVTTSTRGKSAPGSHKTSPSPENNTREGRLGPVKRAPPSISRKPVNAGVPPLHICHKCKCYIHGQFVRALGNKYHLECFVCTDCHSQIAARFFPDDESTPKNAYCETCFFRRLGLLCFSCEQALRGSYITAMGRKYHLDHFHCNACELIFGPEDSYYEHEDGLYCLRHYCKFAASCEGCRTPILKQYVEIYRNGPNQHWHPECYMIHKYWNVRLWSYNSVALRLLNSNLDGLDEENWSIMQKDMESTEEQVVRIWRVLSEFEENSASSISDMLLYASNRDAHHFISSIAKFLLMLEVLCNALSAVDVVRLNNGLLGVSFVRELKLLCKKTVKFLEVVAQGQILPQGRITRELVAPVSGLAHYMKLLIRIGLQGALKGSQKADFFLDKITNPKKSEYWTDEHMMPKLRRLANSSSDLCLSCQKPIDSASYLDRNLKILQASQFLWCPRCLTCQRCHSSGAYNFETDIEIEANGTEACAFCSQPRNKDIKFVSIKEQFIYLLWVALARFVTTKNIEWEHVIEGGGTTTSSLRELRGQYWNDDDNGNNKEEGTVESGIGDVPRNEI